MTEPAQLLALFAVGTAAGFLNVMAGGGSTLVLPVLILLGLDSTLANGTNRVAIAMQNVAAVSSFRRRSLSDFAESTRLSLLTLPGAVAGAVVAARIDDQLFERILGVVIIGVVISMFVPPTSARSLAARTGRTWLVYPAMLAIGFYGGFIQVGVGFLLMAALYHLCGLDLVRVNMHKVFIVLVYTVPALAVFAWTGNVDWMLGAVLGLGNAFGGWWSAHAQVKKGEPLIRWLLVVAIGILALELLGVL
jgi:hypothetical protein